MAGGLPQGVHAITSVTPGNLVLDAGVLYANIDLTALRASGSTQYANAILNAKRLGATRGGATFHSGKVNRNIAIDGKRTPIMELNRIDMYEPKLSCTLLEQTLYNIELYLGSSNVTIYTAYREVVGSIVVDTADYQSNIALFATIAGTASGPNNPGGSNLPIVIVIDNPLCTSAAELPFVDKNEMAVKVEFTGHSTASAPSVVPFHIFRPNDVGS